MPRPKRQRVATTDDWQQLRLLLQRPQQVLCEPIRPIVLFGRSSGERAKETGTPAVAAEELGADGAYLKERQ